MHRSSESVAAIATALAKAQTELSNPEENSRRKVEGASWTFPRFRKTQVAPRHRGCSAFQPGGSNETTGIPPMVVIDIYPDLK